MLYHKQKFLYEKDKTFGSCYPTVIACLLDKQLEEVPDFSKLFLNETKENNLKKILEYKYCNGDFNNANYNEQQNYMHNYSVAMNCWNNVLNYWLAMNGYIEEWIPLEKYNEWLETNKNIPYMVFGMSTRNVQHVVIYQNGKMIHDPHPEGNGIKELKKEPYSYLKKII